MDIYNSKLKNSPGFRKKWGWCPRCMEGQYAATCRKLWKLPNSGIHHNPTVYGTGFLTGVNPKGLNIGIEKAF